MRRHLSKYDERKYEKSKDAPCTRLKVASNTISDLKIKALQILGTIYGGQDFLLPLRLQNRTFDCPIV